jgi:large subunit ribosomal protein L17
LVDFNELYNPNAEEKKLQEEAEDQLLQKKLKVAEAPVVEERRDCY